MDNIRVAHNFNLDSHQIELVITTDIYKTELWVVVGGEHHGGGEYNDPIMFSNFHPGKLGKPSNNFTRSMIYEAFKLITQAFLIKAQKTIEMNYLKNNNVLTTGERLSNKIRVPLEAVIDEFDHKVGENSESMELKIAEFQKSQLDHFVAQCEASLK